MERMMNNMIIPTPLDDSISNLTSASNEASISSSNRNHEVGIHHLYPQPPPSKKKRNLPGNPDPDAEVMALSPNTLMATNRFMCEICNKGFKRDQNLQLHRRGHNLPWKLKQRTNKEVIKKVYVCPELTCVHHDPLRALGDLTGIKKHFSRKHGEKKWKCEKCSKKYAVQSDWKAHSKICGTREYRCDCGTIFSRRDSFITHRAFCDALAEESTRAITAATNQLAGAGAGTSSSTALRHLNLSQLITNNNSFQPSIHLKTEQQDLTPHNWFSHQPLLLSTRLDHQNSFLHQNPSQYEPTIGSSSPLPHMSATALLQKASQMGVTVSNVHMGNSTNDWSTGMSGSHMVHNVMGNSQIHESSNGFEGSSFEEALSGMLNPKLDQSGRLGGGNPNQGLTRDFLGLRAIPNMSGLRFDHHHHQIQSSSMYNHNHNQPRQNNQEPWQG
ncbi:protein indeterminate-domain 11-like [Impatiens glandulifera]|uniref:protein indeterminate-domain 11-like n=1 Tax=Impatiens glandulifera TaxID=253017 RepID=UPI001FB0FC06|nr:protein indeterminate-domain 11-like [Impatiens glandulifera]